MSRSPFSARGLVNPEILITHEVPLREAVRGFEAMWSRDEHRLKVMFRTGGEKPPVG
ncbi:MAG: hypothetical protein QM695_00770 [Micropruina sp.]